MKKYFSDNLGISFIGSLLYQVKLIYDKKTKSVIYIKKNNINEDWEIIPKLKHFENF